jgi:hypothetical protein
MDRATEGAGHILRSCSGTTRPPSLWRIFLLKRTAGRRPDGSFTCQITRGNAYATAPRVVRDTPYAITARRALLIAAPDDPEPLAPMCGVPLMYDVALSHSMTHCVTLYSCDRYAIPVYIYPVDSTNMIIRFFSSLHHHQARPTPSPLPTKVRYE